MQGVMGLTKLLLLLLRQPSYHLPFQSTFRRLHLTSLRFLLASAASRDPSPPPKPTHFMVDYVVSSCGLSRTEALKATRKLVHVKSPKRPDAVLRLLRREGLGDAHIRMVVRRRPDLLVSDAEKTLQPKIAALRGAGFSGSELAQLISTNPEVLRLRNVLPRIEFWRNLVGNKQNLLKALNNHPRLLTRRVDERIIPVLSLLRSLGIPEDKIRAMIVNRMSGLIRCSVDKIRALAEEAQSLGVSPGTGAFTPALCALADLSRSTLDAKSRFLRSFGWSQAEFTTAFRRCPHILCYSREKIQKVMNLLLNDAGCEPSYVASRPALLGYSMEKRLVPRLRVLDSLRVKGLPRGGGDLHTAMMVSEKKFVEKYIAPHRKECPELFEDYLAATAKNSSSRP